MPRTFDIFFGFSQIEIDGRLPSEAEMFDNLLRQTALADRLGFDTAWVGGAHLSLAEHHATAPDPVLPHFRGEVCLNTDILQLAPLLYSRTRRIHVGSAIQSILAAGGPIGHAEAVRTFATLHARSPHAERRLRFGYGSGRFEFVHRAFGIGPRTPAESVAWPALRGRVLRQAVEIFCRLVVGESLASTDLEPIVLDRAAFRSDDDWQRTCAAWGTEGEPIAVDPFWTFDRLRLVPRDADLSSVDFYLGSTDPAVVARANRHVPTRVFNLSNTDPAVIERTHEHLRTVHHPAGGPWKREWMPRTVLCFVDDDPGRTAARQSEVAREKALGALAAWQNAMEGTIATHRLESELQNAVVGNPEEVAAQIAARFHPDDRLMLWFDFNNHDSDDVERTMRAFHDSVVPRLG